MLGMHEIAFTSADPGFCTYKQAQDHGWQVNKGARGTTVFFYKPLQVDDASAKDGVKIILRWGTFNVFHRSQITGFSSVRAAKDRGVPWRSDEATNVIMKNSGIEVRVGSV